MKLPCRDSGRTRTEIMKLLENKLIKIFNSFRSRDYRNPIRRGKKKIE